MRPVRALRWLLIFLFYLAAELSSPLMLAPIEAFEGEAAEAVQRAGHHREMKVAVARQPRAAGGAVAVVGGPAPTSVPIRARTHAPAARKIPGAPASEPAPSPEDH